SAELAGLFRSLGFSAVRTVLASGNVAFECDERDAGELKHRIEQALRERFGYDAWIVLVTREKLAEIVAAFPFDAEREGWHPYVLFASDAEHLRELAALSPELDPDEEAVAPGDGVLYWQLNITVGSTNTKLAKIAAKARYKPTTTNRNLRTLRKLL
ncbi:MAG: DUF1697 domain-containing protein, partial [Microbacteriaceae bacterium]|nr:DUF1697 domain-containing protein [Microbacteriaceae bacterium]